jgi:hypothetical protein
MINCGFPWSLLSSFRTSSPLSSNLPQLQTSKRNLGIESLALNRVLPCQNRDNQLCSSYQKTKQPKESRKKETNESNCENISLRHMSLDPGNELIRRRWVCNDLLKNSQSFGPVYKLEIIRRSLNESIAEVGVEPVTRVCRFYQFLYQFCRLLVPVMRK